LGDKRQREAEEGELRNEISVQTPVLATFLRQQFNFCWPGKPTMFLDHVG